MRKISSTLGWRLEDLYIRLVRILPPALNLHERSPLHLGSGDPLAVLVIAILSQATSDRNCLFSYQSLKATFPNWESVEKADDTRLAEAIRAGGLANNKAPRIKGVLRAIQEEWGEYSLDWLAELKQSDGYAFLTSLPGVGLKTAACVWAFGLGKPALPVDTHVYRVITRLGILPESNPDKLQLMLESAAPPQIQRDLHILLIHFGREICRKRNPQCVKCIFAQECFFATSSQISDTVGRGGEDDGMQNSCS